MEARGSEQMQHRAFAAWDTAVRMRRRKLLHLTTGKSACSCPDPLASHHLIVSRSPESAVLTSYDLPSSSHPHSNPCAGASRAYELERHKYVIFQKKIRLQAENVPSHCSGSRQTFLLMTFLPWLFSPPSTTCLRFVSLDSTKIERLRINLWSGLGV